LGGYPNLFLLGAAKCGTTSLHYYLNQHPSIHMSREKEPNYFSFAEAPVRPLHVISDPHRYRALFDSDLPIRGEASVTYTFHPYPAGVPERIHAVAPDAKFIYLVRDPVRRALSHYRHRVVLGEETRTLSEVVHDPDEPTERYLAASSFAHQAEQYLRLFSQDRFLFLEHGDLLANRDRLLRTCFEFLEVDPTFVSQKWSRRLNETDGQRRYSALANTLRHSAPYRRTIGWMSPDTRARLLAPVRRLLTQEVQLDEDVDPALLSIWAERLAPQAAAFRALSGLELADWSV
jgi:hypothetical protein